MTPTAPTAVLLVAAMTVGGVGLVDAVVSRDLDMVGLLSLLAALHVLLLSRLRGGRVELPLRRDLVGWLRERAALVGEPVEVLADRAVAVYRASYGDDDAGREVEVAG